MPRPPYSKRTGSLHASSPFYKHGLTLIPAWISDHILSKVWDEIIYSFSNFNGCTVEVWEWISNFIPHFTFHNGCDYLSMLGSKLNQINKRGPVSSAAMYWVCGINRSLLSTRGAFPNHYDDVTMSTMASQITSLTIIYSIVYSGTDKRKHQTSASLAFVRGIHRDRWIPCTKGQWRGKCFHLMT